MIPSLILNILNAVLVAVTVILGIRKSEPRRAVFRYFTTLSNVFCAIASVAVAAAWWFGEPPLWVLVLKFVGTAAVTVTLLTVFLFLGPVSHDWKGLLCGEVFFLHLICPLLAIVSLLVFERPHTGAWLIALGVAPVALYAMLYWYKVIRAPEERRWKDFYGFNRNGKWPLMCTLMLIGTSLLSLALWLICL